MYGLGLVWRDMLIRPNALILGAPESEYPLYKDNTPEY